MSAALKSATGSTSFGLRRTASLEEFLDKDKEEVSIELNQPPIYKRKTSEDSSRLSRKSGESYYTYIITYRHYFLFGLAYSICNCKLFSKYHFEKLFLFFPLVSL